MAITGLCQAKPEPVPDDWKTECIGYFNISVPGEVDIAMAGIGPEGEIKSPVFSYFRQPMLLGLAHGGGFQVTGKVPYDFFINKKNSDIEKQDKRLIEQAKTGGSLKSYDNSRDDFFSKTFADSEDTWISSYQWADGRMYLHEVTTVYNKFSKARLKAHASEFSEQFRPRKLYEIPQEPGYCIPYGFVKNEIPQHPRKMALSMVLKDHPDVTIELREWGIPLHSREPDSAKDSIKEFWGIDGYAERTKVLGFPRYPAVEMGGQKGRSVFVEITLPEECGYESFPWRDATPPIVCKPSVTDYGYMAYVTGEPSVKEDKPNLTLVVSTDSQYGPNGKPTISKDELRKMAETIAASVKRR
jgi:hypothetical protein